MAEITYKESLAKANIILELYDYVCSEKEKDSTSFSYKGAFWDIKFKSTLCSIYSTEEDLEELDVWFRIPIDEYAFRAYKSSFSHFSRLSFSWCCSDLIGTEGINPLDFTRSLPAVRIDSPESFFQYSLLLSDELLELAVLDTFLKDAGCEPFTIYSGQVIKRLYGQYEWNKNN